MTRLERKKAELDKLYSYRAAAMRNNDIVWLQKSQQKIEAMEREIQDIRRHESDTLLSALDGKGEEAKDAVCKALLRVNLMADAMNDACMVARELMSRYGVEDFSFRSRVAELCRLSQGIADIAIIPKNTTLESLMVDDGEFVDRCMAAADEYLKDKLGF